MIIRTLLLSLGIGLLGISLRAGADEGRPEPLRFFLVFAEEQPGTRYHSTEQFPDLGFIHSEPDLVFEEVESTRVNIRTDVIVTTDPISGERKEEYVPRRLVTVTLDDQDTEKFASFTSAVASQHRGARILIKVGDEAIFAPSIHRSLDTGKLQLVVATRNDAEAIAERLQKPGETDESSAEADLENSLAEWREATPSAEAYAIVDLLGWVDLLANVPYISKWEELSDEEREKFETTSTYNLEELRHFVAVWINGEFPEEHRTSIRNFLDCGAGRSFWEALLDRGKNEWLKHEDLRAWFEERHDGRADHFLNQFSEDQRKNILAFLDSEAGAAFWAMLVESFQLAEWSLTEKLSDWFEKRHWERWEFVGKD